jgi:hypothetical protein
LIPLLLAHSTVRFVRTIEVVVQPLGGDSFEVKLDTTKPSVGEVIEEITRLKGPLAEDQQLYKVAARQDGGAVREDDAEPEMLADDTHLGDGELLTLAVSDPFDHLGYQVTGVGSECCNGVYEYDGTFKDVPQFTLLKEDGSEVTLVRCKLNLGYAWYMSELYKGNPFDNKTMDFTPLMGGADEPLLPPISGWKTKQNGQSPVPMFLKVRVINPSVTTIKAERRQLRQQQELQSEE